MKQVVDNIIKFEKRSWAMKPYAAFRWGEGMPCPLRFTVNTYKGCDFRCKYCYVWYKKKQASPKENFRKALEHDIQRAKKLGLDFVVFISSSTDPLQPIEEKNKETFFALEKLLGSGFPVLIMTKNPAMLLNKEYLQFVKNPKLFIDVTVASLNEDKPTSIFSSAAPNSKEKTEAIKKLTELGKNIRVKVEPVIPSANGIQGQTKEELWELVKLLKGAGVKMVISKTMRLNEDVPPFLYEKLIDYYKKNGSFEGVNWTLSKQIKKELLQPLFEACKHYKIPFCPCVEVGIFPEKETVNCLLKGEVVPPIMKVVEETPVEWLRHT